MEQFKILPKNPSGIKFILTILDNLKNKNEYFLNRSFNWFTRHPPFPSSHLLYDINSNHYLFHKFKTRLLGTKWSDFNQDSWICEYKFMYQAKSPFLVVISQADWILNLRKKKLEEQLETISTFISWYHNMVDMERQKFKSLISQNEAKPSQELF